MLEKLAQCDQSSIPTRNSLSGVSGGPSSPPAPVLSRVQALEEGLTAVDRSNDQAHEEYRQRLARIESILGI